MAAKGNEDCEILLKEFEKWQETTSSETIFLLEVRVYLFSSNFHRSGKVNFVSITKISWNLRQ